MFKVLIISYLMGVVTGSVGVFVVKGIIALRLKLKRLAAYDKKLENKKYSKQLMSVANYKG